MIRNTLGEFEELVLLMVLILGTESYGVKIMHEIIEQTNRTVRLNQVHASLHRLEAKGMVKSKMGDPSPERGGRRKRIFKITANGRHTLNEIKAVRAQLWQRIPSSQTSGA
jgi:PadR family transcriptional regulator, regulatory protein PadR